MDPYRYDLWRLLEVYNFSGVSEYSEHRALSMAVEHRLDDSQRATRATKKGPEMALSHVTLLLPRSTG